MDKQRRNTKSKQLVTSILEHSDSALSHEDIEKRMPEKIDRVTIYRILQSFCDSGKVHKIVNADGKTYYALCQNCTPEKHHDNHPHFHCMKCNEITCIETTIAEQTLPPGYNALSASSFISGYCLKCNNLIKTLCLFALFFAAQNFASAQTKITVLDAESKSPVTYANIYYPDMKTGITADSLGQFKINFSATRILVQISAVGYQTFLDFIDFTQNEQQFVYLQASIHELQEVVVSDNSSRLQGENVMSVEKLYVKDGSVQGISLTDKLSSVAGIDNLSTGAGIGKPVIRGLSGNRIAVFAQGVRIENQQWGDEHGLGLDENGYEQVEIIKGPASLLYGSDALGGVLYFVDERYAKNNEMEAVFSSEFHSNTKGLRNNGIFKLSKDRLHWNLSGGYTSHTDYQDAKKQYVQNSRFNTGNLKSSLGYVGKKFSISFKYNFLKENYGLTEAENHEHEEEHEDEEHENEIHKNGRKLFKPYQDLSTHLIGSENTFFFDNGSKLKIDAGYIFNKRKEFENEHQHSHEHEEEHLEEEAHDDENAMASLEMNLNTFSFNTKWYSRRWNNRWTLTAGTQAMAQSNVNRGEEILIPDANTYDLGLFAMSDFNYFQKAYLQFGLRFDTRHIVSDLFSKQYESFNFSAGIYQPLFKNLSFRLYLSSGFRAPNMYELLSDGIHHGTNRYETGNQNLKTENNYQTDLSLKYRTKHVELFINPYFSYIRNYIYLQQSDAEINGSPAFNYVQNDARLYGGEAGFHFHPHPLDWLHIEGSYAGTFGEDIHGNYLSLMPSQKLSAIMSANFQFNKKKNHSVLLKKFSIYAKNQYSFKQNRVADKEIATPAYNLLNAGMFFEFDIKSQKIRLDISANNLLNEWYYDHLSRYKVNSIYNMGRNFHVKILFNLFKDNK